MSVVTQGNYKTGGMTGRPMGPVSPYSGSGSSIASLYSPQVGRAGAGGMAAKTWGGPDPMAVAPTPTFEYEQDSLFDSPAPSSSMPPPLPPLPMPPISGGGGGGGGGGSEPEMAPMMPAPSMQALGARDSGSSQILERPSPGVNPMMGMRTRPPSMRVLQARAY